VELQLPLRFYNSTPKNSERRAENEWRGKWSGAGEKLNELERMVRLSGSEKYVGAD